MVVAELALLGGRAQRLELPVEAVPDVEQDEEVGVRVAEGGVDGVGLRGQLRRALARVAHAEAGGEDRDLGQAALAMRLDEHAREARVERHAGHDPSPVRQRPGIRGHSTHSRFKDRAELDERLVAVAHGLRRRPVDEREGERVAQPEVDHPQDDLGQVGAQDLGRGELVARLVIGLRVEPHAQPLADAAAPPLALVGRLRARPG